MSGFQARLPAWRQAVQSAPVQVHHRCAVTIHTPISGAWIAGGMALLLMEHLPGRLGARAVEVELLVS
ncbi:hypothetical protein [Streptomyces sp. NPDC059378]|uniref:hypothetical protein n=1 Tax=Streptomyces sp. NPDC059378 TaxID=3346815 RepID=UPI0036A0A54D